MLRVFQPDTDEFESTIRDLVREYMNEVVPLINAELEVEVDPEDGVASTMRDLGKYSPPHGCLLLAEYDGEIAGIGCLRTIGPDTAEFKRMYVRPAFRRLGIGRALLACLIEEARQMRCASVLLDTLPTLLAARTLYASAGFHERGPYPESEIPKEFRRQMVFMERAL